MRLIGILIIINALILTAWWVSTHNKYTIAIISLCALTVFVGIVLLVLEQATEISFKGIGTIKKAAQQANIDAEAVSKLKERVEAQSATVDLIAKSAQESSKDIGKIKTIIEFSTTLLAAENDNYTAFQQLLKWTDDNSFPFRELAANAYTNIRASYAGPIIHGYLNITWPTNIDPQKLTIQELTKTYSEYNPIFHANLVNIVWQRPDIPQKDKINFLIHVLQTSNSLTAKDHAGRFLIQLISDPNLKWEPFTIEPLLKWWEKNQNTIK